ncbi:hypothetical protein QBZ16_004988 [Prototheca wickerhamii]|uniref:C3H1-type domain-containing protein n=1 Tax=Prototheca wickerhamii TaxID=3111 RepID=A0AAD9MGQ3_PROWI|nr:hypothetical protein QBZ16_004988 [Prototheca wickerhamii]
MCTHQDCAYLHVKHPAGTAPCPRFLQGFCPDGASCKLRHVTQAMLREERQRGVTDAYRASLFAEDASETPDDVADLDYIPM